MHTRKAQVKINILQLKLNHSYNNDNDENLPGKYALINQTV